MFLLNKLISPKTNTMRQFCAPCTDPRDKTGNSDDIFEEVLELDNEDLEELDEFGLDSDDDEE